MLFSLLINAVDSNRQTAWGVGSVILQDQILDAACVDGVISYTDKFIIGDLDPLMNGGGACFLKSEHTNLDKALFFSKGITVDETVMTEGQITDPPRLVPVLGKIKKEGGCSGTFNVIMLY